jgi:CheY-like chemotaxis protein
VTRNYSSWRQRKYDVLLIEPDPDDVGPFIESFEGTDATEAVHVVSDGDEALDYLHGRDAYESAPRPDLILLDLDLSGTSGEAILEELSDADELGTIPVLVLTHSDTGEDVARSYELNANAYLDKPDTDEEFGALASAIEEFWLKLAHLPPK